MAPPMKKRKTALVEEIEFDFAAREEYLTGFHKRKLQRAKHAQEEATKKERLEKLDTRKQLREQRKNDLHDHVAAVNAILKNAQQDPSDEEEPSSDDGGETGANDASILPEDPLGEQEYVDEDKYTTVTIEPMKFSSGDDEEGDESTEDRQEETSARKPISVSDKGGQAASTEKRIWTKNKPETGRPKKKKKKFRYENKVERRANRMQQRSKNSAAAKVRREASGK